MEEEEPREGVGGLPVAGPELMRGSGEIRWRPVKTGHIAAAMTKTCKLRGDETRGLDGRGGRERQETGRVGMNVGYWARGMPFGVQGSKTMGPSLNQNWH